MTSLTSMCRSVILWSKSCSTYNGHTYFLFTLFLFYLEEQMLHSHMIRSCHARRGPLTLQLCLHHQAVRCGNRWILFLLPPTTTLYNVSLFINLFSDVAVQLEESGIPLLDNDNHAVAVSSSDESGTLHCCTGCS